MIMNIYTLTMQNVLILCTPNSRKKKYTLDEKDLFWFILNNKCYLKLKILNENSFFFKVT